MAVLGSKSPIKSIQRGSSTVSLNLTASITISAVDTAKSFLLVSTRSGSHSGNLSSNAADGQAGGAVTCSGAITGTTTVVLYAGNIDLASTVRSGNPVANWEVVEYV